MSLYPFGDVAINTDKTEVQKFSRIASSWWDTSGPVGLLHTINPLRMKWLTKHLPLAHTKILDIGCGGGILTEALAKKGALVTGIDQSEELLHVAQTHALAAQLCTVTYQHITAEELSTASPAAFDAVICFELLEHVPDPQLLVSSCALLVKPGGSVFFATLNRTALSYALAILGAEYVFRILPKGTHDWQKFITPAELAKYGRQAELSVLDIQGFTYVPIVDKVFYTRPLVNYLMAHRKVA